MNTRSTFRHLSLLVLVILVGVPGCGYTQGKLLYFMGFGQGQKIEAKVQLTDKSILLLVDDPAGYVTWPIAMRYLEEQLGQELIKKEAATHIVPPQTLQMMRQTISNFEKLSSREIGERAGAEQVIWLEVRNFLVTEQIHDTQNVATFAVAVKVLNVLEKKNRLRVRIWPSSPDGKLVMVGLSGSEVMVAKTKNGISQELSRVLAIKIAKLFYDHRLAEFEKEEE